MAAEIKGTRIGVYHDSHAQSYEMGYLYRTYFYDPDLRWDAAGLHLFPVLIPSVMNKFLRTSILFLVIVLVTGLIFFGINKNYVAAYRITNSYSFNEKINFLPDEQDVRILGLGSSITLNNLSSEAIIELFETDSFLNVASWGIKMEDMYKLLKEFDPLYDPEVIICVSSIIDFSLPGIEFDSREIGDYLHQNKRKGIIHDLSNISYYLRHTIKNRIYQSSNKYYSSLMFDEHGGVALNQDEFRHDPYRWNKRLSFHGLHPSSYHYLDSISVFAAKRGIELILVQTPVRENAKRASLENKMDEHENMIRSILEPRDQHFINGYRLKFPDKYFADYTHMNEKGAEELTRILYEKYSEDMEDRFLTLPWEEQE
jgi:hypothetical protein